MPRLHPQGGERANPFFNTMAKPLAMPTSDAKVRSVAKQILGAADRLNVDRQSLAVLVALSCLFEDPRSGMTSIGRKILKPRQTYTAEEAYNAICDLRHIELAAFGHAWVTEGQFALCTSDKAVDRKSVV